MTKMEITQGLNQSQRHAVLATEGPVLLLAGPGTGKTATLVRRTLHIIQSGLAKPEEIILCSFTEKSAHELKERVARDAKKFGVEGDLSGLVTGTIHGICNSFIDRHLHSTPLGNNYDVLDEMTQLLFIFQHFDEIVGEAVVEDDEYPTYVAGKYSSKWTAIKGLARYFDKITEELIDPEELLEDSDEQTQTIGQAYISYAQQLAENNKIDFANLQRITFDLIKSGHVTHGELPKYVMVDEFQDTNFIQERLVAKLASNLNNICVVGDEDQSLYRFRGATVENILNFPQKWQDCQTFTLDVNYRSEPRIVNFYSHFMKNGTWEKSGRLFRFNKELEPASYEESESPSVLRLHSESKDQEANKLAELIAHLKSNNQISDYSQVAILLNSVRFQHSSPFINALESLGIKAFCPRSKAFFDNSEVGQLIACLAYIFDWTYEHRGSGRGRVTELAQYVDYQLSLLLVTICKSEELGKLLHDLREEVRNLSEGETLDKRVADYVYLLITADPFYGYMQNEITARNISRISNFLSTFHQYYRFPIISHKNLPALRNSLFASFFSFLLEGGADDYEDPNQPFPKDHVQIMTVHQAKGLEFPVVVAGNLHYKSKNQLKEMHERLGRYMPRTPNEPPEMIGEFDSMRLFYVAFSRPQNLLILSSNDEKAPDKRMDGVWPLAHLLDHPRSFSTSSEWEFKPHEPLKKSFSFTSDIRAYESCARQYHFFNQIEFSPSRAVTILFGTLVHQTIEDIHRLYLRGLKETVSEVWIESQFNFNYKMLQLKEVRFMAEAQKDAALRQVVDYWKQNIDYLDGVREAEIDVSLEKDNYVLAGSIDLVSNLQGELEILDFKTGEKPAMDKAQIRSYYQQLCIYAHIFQSRTGQIPKQLVLYWTGERSREDARMVFPYIESDVNDAISHFDSVVRNIQEQNFEMVTAPDKKICNECDFKAYCQKSGLIK